MISQDQGESGKEDSENGEDSSLTVAGTSERSERSPSVTDETSIDCSEKSVSVQKYEEEWERIYCQVDPHFAELRERALAGNLRTSYFRSVCWRAFLGVFSEDKKSWLMEVRRFRQHYKEITLQFNMEPWLSFNSHDDPLNKDATSCWNQHFCDNELKAVIYQDIVRAFPGMDFFHKECIQKAMLNVLFVYARENPKMCYRQGMHEILGPLLFVLHCDHQALLHAKEHISVSITAIEILDPTFIEADAYSMFCLIMDNVSCYYKVNDVTPTATGYFPSQSPNQPAEEKEEENEMFIQLESIKESILRPNDEELAEHLNKLQIYFPVFGIRWLRLLFGREFPLQDLLVLWDAIFAEDNNFILVNYVAVAILIANRKQLLSSDYAACLTLLIRGSGTVDVTFVIDHALHLKDNQKYKCPSEPCPVVPKIPNANLDSKIPGHKHSGYPSRSQSMKEKGQQRKSRSSASLSDRFKKLSTKSGQWNSGKIRHSGVPMRGEGDATSASTGIVEGYALNDPSVMVSELKHAHAVMSLCHLKLVQYHKIISDALDPSKYPEASQALDGMNELCTLLDNRKRVDKPLEVETAYEAGEGKIEHTQVSSSSAIQTVPLHRTATPPSHLYLPVAERVKRELRKPGVGSSHSSHSIHSGLLLSGVPLETFKECSESQPGEKKNFPSKDPLKCLKDKNKQRSETADDRPFEAASFVEFWCN